MQKIKKYSAFTLVELIVVIVVLTVLSTVGFVSYSKYIAGSRDTNRIVQLNNISEGLSTLSLTSKLPLPENNINISVGGNIFAYQWDLTEETMDILGYKEWGKYIEITYMLSDNRKYFQLMTFVEDESFAQSSKSLIHSTYAVENKGIYPITIGMPLGILIWKTEEIPVQKIASIANAWIFEINTPSIPVLSYVYEWDYIDSSTDNLSYMILNSSCVRIKQLGKSDGDGEYIISPDSISKINVYCDMMTDWGGWILTGRLVNSSEANAFIWNYWWKISVGDINNNSMPYSFWEGIFDLYFKEILFTWHDGWYTPKHFLFKYMVSSQDLQNLETTTQNFPCITLQTFQKASDQSFTNCSSNFTTLGNINSSSWYRTGSRYSWPKSFNVGTRYWENINGEEGMIFVR